MAASAKGRKNDFDRFVCNAFSKICRTVAEARLLAPGVRKNKDNDEHFFIHTRIVSEVDEDLPDLVRARDGTPAHLLVFTVSIDTHGECLPPGASVSCRMHPGVAAPKAGPGQQPSPRAEGGWEGDSNLRYRVLERWILQRQVHETDSSSGPNQAVVKQLLLLVRAVHSCLRLLPCHKTAVQMQNRNASKWLKYRLSTSLASMSNESCFGTNDDPVHEYSFGDVDTPSGRICVKVQYSVSNPEDYMVAATEFPTQGLQRREQRSLSLPAEEFCPLVAPDSPLGALVAPGGALQTRHYSPQGFPLQQSTGMGVAGGGACTSAHGSAGRPPRVPSARSPQIEATYRSPQIEATSATRLSRRSLEGAEGHYGSPGLSAAPGPQEFSRLQEYSPSQRAPQELGPLSSLTLPGPAAPGMSPAGSLGAMMDRSGRGTTANIGHMGGLGGGGGGGIGASAGSGRGVTEAGVSAKAGASSSSMAVPGAQQPSSTAFVDHLQHQQQIHSSTPHAAAVGGMLGTYTGPASPSPGGWMGGSFFPGSSPGGAAFFPSSSPGGAGDGFGVMLSASPSSPSYATGGAMALAQSFEKRESDSSLWNDVGRDVVGSPGDQLEVMQRVLPPSRAKQKERQKGGRQSQDADTCDTFTHPHPHPSAQAHPHPPTHPTTSDATWVASLDGEEHDEGAPFAVLDDEGGVGGVGSRGLHALMRLLEKKEMTFLLEEDAGVSGGGSGGCSVGEAGTGGFLDSELDSFLSMPAASDLSVGDVIWDMQQMQEVIETQIQPLLNAVNFKP